MKNPDNYKLLFCKFCNKPFFGLKTKIKQSLRGGFYCSKECQKFYEFKRKLIINKNGYVIIPIIKNGKITQCYLHREIMQVWLGRKLYSCENVHHINKDKTNNLISNLSLMSRKKHIQLHLKKYGKILCSVKDCKRLAIKRNFCNKHYLRGWKNKNFDINKIVLNPIRNNFRDEFGRFVKVIK